MVSGDTIKELTKQGFGGRHVGEGIYEVIPLTWWMSPGAPCPGGVIKSYIWKCTAWDCSKCPLKDITLQ